MTNEIWIMGATGRSGGAVAARLSAAGIPVVLVGRSRERLDALAATLGASVRVIAGSFESQLKTLESLGQDGPRVVVSTVGPFAETSLRVASACPPGTHYVDISNEFSAVEDILRLDARAKSRGQVLVTGAGFGVLGTEAVVARLCEGQPRPLRVRVDAIASVASNGGRVGAALAGSIIEVMQYGGREVRSGRLVRSATSSHPERVTTPDGDIMGTGGGASGELLAAWNASDADEVVAASIAAPTSPLMRRVALPALSVLIRIPGAARLLGAAIARITLKEGPMARSASWGHARVEWADGRIREGWLRAGDGSDFTADVMAEVARRLYVGEGAPGAYTPAALFGAELAESVGAQITVTPATIGEQTHAH